MLDTWMPSTYWIGLLMKIIYKFSMGSSLQERLYKSLDHVMHTWLNIEIVSHSSSNFIYNAQRF